jgi:2-dehydropantoate 2-reductase
MRVLVVGAGAIGGYFGGRLLQAGRDVTFLVRPRRAAELAAAGLIIESPHGDVTLHQPATILADDIRHPFDLVLLSCKAYDLAGAMDSFAAAVGPETMILPLLNGMKHLALLDERFGRPRVLGGLCIIAATLNAQRAVVHLNSAHTVAFGERDGSSSIRIQDIAGLMGGAGFDGQSSAHIVQEMWEKWVFLATLASVTCLMRTSIGDILASPRGDAVILSLLEECRAIAEAEGYPPRVSPMERMRSTLTAAGSPFTASMLRDIEAGAQIEAEHIVGDLLRRRSPPNVGRGEPSLLETAYVHMKAYEARRARTLAASIAAAPGS